MTVSYSTEYTKTYIAPYDPLYASRTYGNVFALPFNFTNAASGGLADIGDLVYLTKVPPICDILMFESLLRFSAWDTSTTIDIGWLGYTSPFGTAVEADDNGLISGLDVDAAGFWYAGQHHSSTDTTVHLAPIDDIKIIRSRTPVIITAVFRGAAPTASDVFSGYLKVLVN